MDNPEKLAQILQQQQLIKFLQSMQGSGAMTEAERGQMMQGPMSELDAQLMSRPSAPMYGQPMQQGDFTQQPVPMLGAPMQQQGELVRPSAPMPTVGGMGQGAMSNKDLEMMRRMPR